MKCVGYPWMRGVWVRTVPLSTPGSCLCRLLVVPGRRMPHLTRRCFETLASEE